MHEGETRAGTAELLVGHTCSPGGLPTALPGEELGEEVAATPLQTTQLMYWQSIFPQKKSNLSVKHIIGLTFISLSDDWKCYFSFLCSFGVEDTQLAPSLPFQVLYSPTLRGWVVTT